MIKQLAASHVAKSIALCVCPVVAAGVVATKVPQARRMIHKATSPGAPPRRQAALAKAEAPCPQPAIALAPATLPRFAASLPAGVGLPVAEVPVIDVSSPTAGGSFPVGGAFAGGPGTGGFSGFNPGIGGGGGGGGGGFFPGGPGVIAPPSPISGVPEPETWMQVLGGLGVAGATIRFVRGRRQLRAA